MATDIRTERSVREEDSVRERAVTWILLDGNRLVVAAGIVAAFVGTIAVLISVDILSVGPNSSAATIFGSGLASGVVTLVTVALSINQLILSRVFGTPDVLSARLEGSRTLRQQVEEIADRPSSPTDPAAFLSLIATTLSDRASSVLAVSESTAWRAPTELTAGLEDLVAYGQSIDDALGENASVADTLGVVLGSEYALNMAAVHWLRNEYDSGLPEDARVGLRDIEDLLESIAVSRQFFKTMVLQQDFAELSRQIVYSGLLALGCVISLTLIYRTNSVTIPLWTLPLVVSVGIGVAISPLALFSAYILRAATVARKTVSVGPFIPPRTGETRGFEDAIGWRGPRLAAAASRLPPRMYTGDHVHRSSYARHDGRSRMKTRAATMTDEDRICEIAEQSFQASYALSPLDIESIVETEFDADAISEWVDADERLLFVAESDDRVIGFTQARITDDRRGEIVWLHVDPTERGHGVGTELLERVLAELRERAVEEVQATILAQNQEGGEFLDRFEFQRSDQAERTFGEEQFQTEVYSTVDAESVDEERTVPESGEVEVDGQTRFIDPEETISGDEGEFFLVFEEEEYEERFGFYCTNCNSVSNSVDGDGKVVCDSCGNVHSPEEWDGSYL